MKSFFGRRLGYNRYNEFDIEKRYLSPNMYKRNKQTKLTLTKGNTYSKIVDVRFMETRLYEKFRI